MTIVCSRGVCACSLDHVVVIGQVAGAQAPASTVLLADTLEVPSSDSQVAPGVVAKLC